MKHTQQTASNRGRGGAGEGRCIHPSILPKKEQKANRQAAKAKAKAKKQQDKAKTDHRVLLFPPLF
jgi:hypothetical protein